MSLFQSIDTFRLYSLVLSDCIEAGLPYDWERFNIDTDTQTAITRVLLILAEKDSTSGNDFVQHPLDEATETVPKQDEIAVDGDRKGVDVNESTASRGVTDSVLRQCRDRRERENRLTSLRLKDVKELVPNADYWQIRLVLARFKVEGGACLS